MTDFRLRSALAFAARKHHGQMRKGTDIPYIVHPVEVMAILAANGQHDEILIAGLLHDTIEDTGTKPEEIEALFGRRILDLVQAESENKDLAWKERKRAAIDHLRSASPEVKMVCCADKLSNLRSMYADQKEKGEALWERFNAPKSEIKWYYGEIRDAVWGSLSNYPMYQELEELIPLVFG
jgi:myo-inositol-1(or 4)-monophosphatase